MEEEHYRKVYIKSESDLPKNKGAYIVSFKGLPCVSQQFYDPESKGKYGYSTIFLNQIDWYLQPEQPIEQSETFTAINKNLSEADKIIKALSGEEIKDIPTITSTDYPVEQSENNEETVETEFQKRFELLRLQKILNDHIIIDPDKLYVSLRGIEIAFDALVKSESNEIQHGIPFKCPECGKEIQFGFSDAGMKLFAKSRLFEQSEIKTAEEILKNELSETLWTFICTYPTYPLSYKSNVMLKDWIIQAMEEYRQYQPTVSDEEIENGVTELARKYVIQSVGDWAIGYITGAKAMRDNPEQFKMK